MGTRAMREVARLAIPAPDETTMWWFRHLPEAHELGSPQILPHISSA